MRNVMKHLIDILLMIVCLSTNDNHLYLKGEKNMTDFKFGCFWNKPRGENNHLVDESVIIEIRQKTVRGFRV